MIRRDRKRKHRSLDAKQSNPGTPIRDHGSSVSSGAESNTLQSHLATDIEVARERLNGLDIAEHNPLGALSSLSEACAAVWQDAAMFDKTAKTFFLFEDRAEQWVNGNHEHTSVSARLLLIPRVIAFIDTLNRGRPFFSSAPPEVLEYLRACRPHHVQDRAWLVMYYSIILAIVSSTDPGDESTKAKLRCNLWLALNDVRILFEPSEANIQALTLLASHVEEFTTPSLCWMLVTNACRMLQALGVTHRRLDPRTRERRVLLYLLDSGLALVFGRTPTFHWTMAREIPLPALEQLVPLQPHITSTSARVPATFGAHYIHRMMLLSRVIADVWNCLYNEPTPDDSRIESVIEDLTVGYHQAQEACRNPAAELTTHG